MTTETETQKTAKKKPDYIAYQVDEGKQNEEGKKSDSYWTAIGVAFKHKDGKGFNIQIRSVPLDGKISLRVPKERNQ